MKWSESNIRYTNFLLSFVSTATPYKDFKRLKLKKKKLQDKTILLFLKTKLKYMYMMKLKKKKLATSVQVCKKIPYVLNLYTWNFVRIRMCVSQDEVRVRHKNYI